MPNQETTIDLADAMREAGITNRELAYRLKTDQAQISRWRSGVQPRDARTRRKIAGIVGLDEEELWPELK